MKDKIIQSKLEYFTHDIYQFSTIFLIFIFLLFLLIIFFSFLFFFYSRIYQIDAKSCGECHPQCKGSCRGPNADDCFECEHVQDGPFCVETCPSSKFTNEMKTCEKCHEDCIQCSGSGSNDCIKLKTFTEQESTLKPKNELRRFMLEVYGPFTLKFENGTKVLTI